MNCEFTTFLDYVEVVTPVKQMPENAYGKR